jgi:alanine racemase
VSWPVRRERFRPVWCEVDLAAVRDNVRALAAAAAPAALLATVKADGYGHGAVPVARAALEAGARWLGVAFVEEGLELRDAGIDAPVVLLSEPPVDAADVVVAHRLTPIVYSRDGIDALAKAVADAGAPPLPVHLKVDTGMHRVGCPPEAAVELARAVVARDELVLEGLATHLAVADEPDRDDTDAQLDAFAAVRAALSGAGIEPAIVHAANSAALLAFPEARFDLVRAGITVYGIAPTPHLEGLVPLRPALSLHARVSHVQRLPAGSRVSYGLRYQLASDAAVATVPLGYADGVPRNLGLRGGEVLLGGRRCRIAGTVTMDQLLVDCGDASVAVGDEVVLIGHQGDEQITAAEWAHRLDTIAYEIVTRIGARVGRHYRA